jgi:hypothetical protein
LVALLRDGQVEPRHVGPALAEYATPQDKARRAPTVSRMQPLERLVNRGAVVAVPAQRIARPRKVIAAAIAEGGRALGLISQRGPCFSSFQWAAALRQHSAMQR